MFWQIMAPNAGGEPTGPIADAIMENFGDFQSGFNDAGTNNLVVAGFGSRSDGRLKSQVQPRQSNFPIMSNDVWEHAYYLKYQTR